MLFDTNTLSCLHKYLKKKKWALKPKDKLLVYERCYFGVNRKIILPSHATDITDRELASDISQAIYFLASLEETTTDDIIKKIKEID